MKRILSYFGLAVGLTLSLNGGAWAADERMKRDAFGNAVDGGVNSGGEIRQNRTNDDGSQAVSIAGGTVSVGAPTAPTTIVGGGPVTTKLTNAGGTSIQDVTAGDAHVALHDSDGDSVDITPDGEIPVSIPSLTTPSKIAYLEVTTTGEFTILAANVSKSFTLLSVVVVNDGFVKAVGTVHTGVTADASGVEDSNIYTPFSTANNGGIHFPSPTSPKVTALNTAVRINVESVSGSGTLKVALRYLDF
jgi:hypothetical protein